MKFPIKIFRISGHSMEPTLKNGQLVFIFTWFPAQPKDIVVAKIEGTTIVKRLKNWSGKHAVLEGDNQKHSTEKIMVLGNSIIGKLLIK